MHSLFSPSAAHRWMRCGASLLAGESEETEYSKWGTECHEIAARILLTGVMPANENTDEQIATACDYARAVAKVKGDGILLGVEQYLDFDNLVPMGYASQGGTIDAVCLSADGAELQIHDLKTGRGVTVYAADNEQLMLYAIAALRHFGMAGDIERVRLCIHQQRIGHYDEYTITMGELSNFAEAVRETIVLRIDELTQMDDPLRETPGEKQCRWCPRKAECKAYEDMVHEAIGNDFEVEAIGNNRLAHLLAQVPMIEQWCLAIRAKVESELTAGRSVDGYKLVKGRKGPRKWSDDAEAIKILKSMKLTIDQMYSKTVITPPVAEKLVKSGEISAKQFERLTPIITQSEGSLSVAPSTDPRPAVAVVAQVGDFTDETRS